MSDSLSVRPLSEAPPDVLYVACCHLQTAQAASATKPPMQGRPPVMRQVATREAVGRAPRLRQLCHVPVASGEASGDALAVAAGASELSTGPTCRDSPFNNSTNAAEDSITAGAQLAEGVVDAVACAAGASELSGPTIRDPAFSESTEAGEESITAAAQLATTAGTMSWYPAGYRRKSQVCPSRPIRHTAIHTRGRVVKANGKVCWHQRGDCWQAYIALKTTTGYGQKHVGLFAFDQKNKAFQAATFHFKLAFPSVCLCMVPDMSSKFLGNLSM